MAYVKQNTNKKGEIISYRIYSNSKNEITGKRNKCVTKTWKVPKGLSKPEIKKALTKEIANFEEEILKAEAGIEELASKETLVEFAEKWLQTKIRQKEIKRSYIVKCQESIKIFKFFFKDLPLCKLSPRHVIAMVEHLQNKPVQRVKAALKCSIKEKTLQEFGTYTNLCKKAKIGDATFRSLHSGNNVDYATAEKIASAFNEPVKNLFVVKNEEPKYLAKSSIKKTTGVLSAILSSAVAKLRIPVNYATSAYTSIKMKKSDNRVKKEWVYTPEEAREFISTLLEDEKFSIMQKTFFLTELFLGVRKGEALALCWSDVNFDTFDIVIDKSRLYNSTFGVYNETTKTENVRVITAPHILMQQLETYKNYWNTLKPLLSSELMFVNPDGSPVHPSTPQHWLADFYERHPNLKKLSQHKFRHTNITLQILGGVPINVVAERSGHAQTATTYNHYTHFIKNANKMGADAIDRAFQSV